MKGLILKDLMCLRKQRLIFIYLSVCVALLSVLFVLSARFGNIAHANQMMMAENGLRETDIRNIAVNTLFLLLLLPVATAIDVVPVLVADERAHFARVSTILPVSLGKRVLAKFITVLLMLGSGVIFDVLLALGLSFLTDLASFREFLGIIMAAASIVFLYSVLTIFYSFLLGSDKENYAQIGAVLTMLLGVFVFCFKKIRIVWGLIVSEQGDLSGYIEGLMHFLKYRSYLLLPIVAFLGILLFGLTVLTGKRKGGVI